MSQSFTTVKLLHGKEPLLRQMTCEVRYQDGFLYLDNCGRVLKKLVHDRAEWFVPTDPVPNGATLYNLIAGTALRFGSRSASLGLDRTAGDEVIGKDDVNEFTKEVGDVLEIIIDELEVSELSRVGYREQYYFSFDSKEDSEKWIGELELFSVPQGILKAFGATPEALGVALVIQGQNCNYRIAVNGIERSAQVPIGDASIVVQSTGATKRQKQVLLEAMKKNRQRQVNSAFAVVLDFDSFLLEPSECDLARFVEERTSTNLQMFRDAVGKDEKKGKAK